MVYVPTAMSPGPQPTYTAEGRDLDAEPITLTPALGFMQFHRTAPPEDDDQPEIPDNITLGAD